MNFWLVNDCVPIIAGLPGEAATVSSELRSQLERTLGTAYQLDRELGGGGMSRVFVAQETALGRNVVIKVMSPELAAGVNADRFNREIHLAAKLQHPHIVPLLSAGVSEGIPWYTMPLVEGETLREKLARGGELPISEGIRILREVADALDCAHGQGIIHRDIKPDNILLSRQHAVVTDFGVAKALSSSVKSGETLTDIGLALGTPAYMAPEQAAAEPNVDSRADIYALGMVAYEMFAGRIPFAGRSPHGLLAAQIAEQPVDIATVRPSLPTALAALIMRCVEKRPADRPQSASEMMRELDMLAAPGTGTTIAHSFRSAAEGPRFATIAVLYAAAFAGVVGAAIAARALLGVPGWIVAAAVIVMLLGLPMILATAYARRPARSTGMPVSARRGSVERFTEIASPWLTWRRTVLGGVAAVLILAVLIVGYMSSRALGVGPAASLFGAGVMKHRDKVIVAEFGHTGADTSLGAVVSSAFRTDLGQSAVISVAQSAEVTDALRRMQRSPDAPLTPGIAREVAQREGYKAVVEGEIAKVADSYVLTARLVSSATGDVLAPFRETARSSADIIPAIDRLTRQVRGRIGESLKDVRETPPLWKVTTSSLDALRKYVQAGEAVDHGSDYTRAFALLDEAIALDSNFAAAYGTYAVWLYNRGLRPSVAEQMRRRAYELRDRLTEAERYRVIGAYFSTYGTHYDPERAVAANRSLIDLDSSNAQPFNELGQIYRWQRDLPRAASYYTEALRRDSIGTVLYSNLAAMQFGMGQVAEASAMHKRMADRFPNDPVVLRRIADYAFARYLLDSASWYARRIVEVRPGDPIFAREAATVHYSVATIRGKLAERDRLLREAIEAAERAKNPADVFQLRLALSATESRFRHNPQRAVEILREATSKYPPDSSGRLRTGTLTLTSQYARAGRPEVARQTFNQNRALYDTTTDHRLIRQVEATLGDIALAENNPAEALAHYRKADYGSCTICTLPDIAHAYDLAGQSDSALAVYERFVGTPYSGAVTVQATEIPAALERLGQMYEARGDLSKASRYYTQFVELWADADAELQPRVREARRRLDEIRRRSG